MEINLRSPDLMETDPETGINIFNSPPLGGWKKMAQHGPGKKWRKKRKKKKKGKGEIREKRGEKENREEKGKKIEKGKKEEKGKMRKKR